MFLKWTNPWNIFFKKSLPVTEKILTHSCPTFYLQTGPLVKNLCGVGCILRLTFNLQFQQVAVSGQTWLISINTKPVQTQSQNERPSGNLKTISPENIPGTGGAKLPSYITINKKVIKYYSVIILYIAESSLRELINLKNK